MGDLAVDTRLEPTAEPGCYRALLSGDWEIWGPNGGYLAVIALCAAGSEARVRRPSSFHAHFLRVAEFGPVELRVEAIRRGRRSESLRVDMEQDGRPVLAALVRTAAEGPGLEHDVATMPGVPPPESLRSADQIFADSGPAPYPFWRNLESRPIQPNLEVPPPPREPAFCEWFRFRPRDTFEDPFLDAGRALLLIDTLSWPAAARPHPGGAFQAPNLDVTAWFHHAEPHEPWLLGDHASPIAKAGLMGTHSRVWSRGGQLLASGGAQLMCVPRANG